MAFIFSTTKYSGNVTTSAWLATGHDGDDAMIIGGSGKLILSASNGTIHLSGALDVGLVPDNKAYHVRSIGSPLILSSSGGGSFVYASGNLTVSEALLVKGDTVLSGNVVVGGQLYDLNSNLILSSSVGSIIAASSSLDFPNIDKAYHIRAVNSNLVFSSSVGSTIYISGNLQASGSHTLTGSVSINDNLSLTLDGPYSIRNSVSHLILSSTVGSVVAFSASEDFVNTDKPYHIRAVNSNLILSSTAGSSIYVSGSLFIGSGSGIPPTLFFGSGSDEFGRIKAATTAGGIEFLDKGGATGKRISAANIFLNGNVVLGSANMLQGLRASEKYVMAGNNSNADSSVFAERYGFSVGTTTIDCAIEQYNTGSLYFSSSIGQCKIDVPGGVFTSTGSLILSSSGGSIVALSASQDFTNTDKTYHIRSVNNHLILSSTIGSVVKVSGALSVDTVATANLLVGADTLSGAIMWDTTRKCLRVYSAEGWVAIATGSTA